MLGAATGAGATAQIRLCGLAEWRGDVGPLVGAGHVVDVVAPATVDRQTALRDGERGLHVERGAVDTDRGPVTDRVYNDKVKR